MISKEYLKQFATINILFFNFHIVQTQEKYLYGQTKGGEEIFLILPNNSLLIKV